MMPWSSAPNDGYATTFWLWVPFAFVFFVATLTAVGILLSSAAAASLTRYPELVPWSPARLRAWKAWVWVPFVGPIAYAIAWIARWRAMETAEWRTARARMDRRARRLPNLPPRPPHGPMMPSALMPGSGPSSPEAAGDGR